jgi:hypothetical protein
LFRGGAYYVLQSRSEPGREREDIALVIARLLVSDSFDGDLMGLAVAMMPTKNHRRSCAQG